MGSLPKRIRIAGHSEVAKHRIDPFPHHERSSTMPSPVRLPRFHGFDLTRATATGGLFAACHSTFVPATRQPATMRLRKVRVGR